MITTGKPTAPSHENGLYFIREDVISLYQFIELGFHLLRGRKSLSGFWQRLSRAIE